MTSWRAMALVLGRPLCQGDGMELWIPITLAAAFVQNIRFMLQKGLKRRLSTLGVTQARFIYGAPLAALTLWILLSVTDRPLPGLTPWFFGFAIWGGLAQIVATAMLIRLFGMANFATGMTLSKTEVVSTVILSAVVLGEMVPPLALFAILLTLAGVLVLSSPDGVRPLLRVGLGPAAVLGIGSGVVFSMASIGYRGAALALEGGTFLERGATTLAVVTAFQAIVLGLWMAWREPGEMGRVLAAWPVAGWVGLTSMLGSLGWFSAFALVNASYVKAVGQVEIVFSLLASIFFFRERVSLRDMAGMALVTLGIVGLVLV
ncbi:MAG: DMT family transporter [Pseudomonadota bacterium]